jgi:hypothetical protein
MKNRESSSFRDNRGFVFWEDGQVYRQINTSGKAAYEQLMSSGLYERLTKDGLLVKHTEVMRGGGADVYRVIRPELIPLVSYPYEWSFSQLKDAALATLRIQKLALEHGMVLRDASAYNIQWVDGRPQLIDTLSFDMYTAGEPWTAYRQFCQHFLAPLALMSRIDPGLLQLLRVNIDGIPLPLAAKMLPLRSRLNVGLATHISLHARFQKQHESTAKRPAAEVSSLSLLALIDNLERTIGRLRLRTTKTQWGDYYGSFSRIAHKLGAYVVSADIDPLAVDANYHKVRKNREERLVPLLIDLTNPSPDLGWANQERKSFTERAQADVALALALIHHLAIANNLPLEMVAEYFARLAPHLVIEFVPKNDSQVKRLLATREDIFPDYTEAGLEAAFGKHFEVLEKREVKGSARTMYLMKRKAAA